MPQSSGSQSTHSSSAGPPADDFGANEWLVEEMYEQYKKDPGSVDATWVTFFKNGHGSNAPAARFCPVKSGRTERRSGFNCRRGPWPQIQKIGIS